MKPQLQFILQQSIQAFQAKNFDRAKSLLLKVLQSDSKNITGLHLLGLIEASQGNYKEASQLLSKAALIDPRNASIRYNLARTLVDCGEDQESLPHHIKAIELDVNNVGAWLNYGLTLLKLNKFKEAFELYDKATNVHPNCFDFYLGKGAALKNLGRYDEAIVVYQMLLRHEPNYVEALSNLGNAYHEVKKYDEALACFDKALNISPGYVEALSNRGSCLNSLRRYSDAVLCYDRAISINPNMPELWANKAITLTALKRYDEAIAHNDKAIDIRPSYAQAWLNKGNVFNELKRFDEATFYYQQAINISSGYAEAWANKGNMLNELKLFHDAIAHYEKAIQLKPSIEWIGGDLIHVKMKVSNWSNLTEVLPDLISRIKSEEKVASPFHLLSLVDDEALHHLAAKIFVQEKFPEDLSLGQLPNKKGSNRIKIGYFSADFKSHPVAYLTAELFEQHDRSQFELYAFSLSKASESDDMRTRLMKTFDHFIDVDHLSDLEVATLARELGIDIAVDLSGLTLNSRTGIFSYLAAPIQVNYLGYPGTLGTEYFDYIIADEVVIPKDSRDFYSEKVVYLPDTYMVDDSKRVPSDKTFSREYFKLPTHGFVFCCFNNSYKFNANVIQAWARILSAVPDSVLWVSENNEEFQKNLISELENLGIQSSRIIFAPRVESMGDHLARYRLADLFLDTYPYNAHTTALDALKAGVPVLTLTGNSFASRVASSLLKAINLPELAAVNQTNYEKLAIELATDQKKLKDVKSRLEKNYGLAPLFNTRLFTKNIELAYQEIYRRYQLGLKPEHISVN